MALVLVADDDRLVAHLVSAILRRAGHTVEVTRDVASTVQRLNEGEHPDCVVLDVNMPDGTAEDVLRQTSAEALQRVPILLLTGATAEEVESYHAEPHVRAVLRKPVAADPLLAAVNAALQAS